MDNLAQFILKHGVSGPCQCPACVKAPQPAISGSNLTSKHTINMSMFEVSIVDNPDAELFKKLTKEHVGHHCDVNPFDGKEHNYLELGAWIGDQGLALVYMAIGAHLGVFSLLSPETLMPQLPQDLRQMMAGSGMISIQSKNDAGRHMAPSINPN